MYCICFVEDGKKVFYGSSGNPRHPLWKKTLQGVKKYQQRYYALGVIEEIIDHTDKYTENNIFLDKYELVNVSTIPYSMVNRMDKINKIKDRHNK